MRRQRCPGNHKRKEKKEGNGSTHGQFCHFAIKLTPPNFLFIMKRQILCGPRRKMLGPHIKIFFSLSTKQHTNPFSLIFSL